MQDPTSNQCHSQRKSHRIPIQPYMHRSHAPLRLGLIAVFLALALLGRGYTSASAQTAATTSCGAQNMIVFDNGAYVDSNNFASSESDTIQATLSSQGHTITTFTDLSVSGWAAALSGKDYLVIPEQEVGTIAPALSSDAISEIQNFVASGGNVLIFGSFARDSNFLNTVFEFSTASSGAGTSTQVTPCSLGNCPLTLPSLSLTLSINTLPAGSIVHYEYAGNATVAIFPYGASGEIGYLGWDWFNAAPLGTQDGGWLNVLDAVTAMTCADAPPNSPPIAYDDAFTIDEDTTLNGNVLDDNGSEADSDPDGDTLTVDVTPISGPSNGTLTLNTNGSFSYSPSGNFNGSDSFEYRISDGRGGTDIGQVTITVDPVNDPPVVAAGDDASGVEGAAISLNGSGSDVDGDLLIFQWTYALGTNFDAGATCTFGAASAAATTITCTDDGDYTVTLTADDDNGGIASADLLVTVSNAAPTIDNLNVGPLLVAVDTPVSSNVAFSDPGANDTHSAAWNWGDDNSSPGTVDQPNDTAANSHSYATPGVYTVQVEVTDDDGDSVSATYTDYVVVYDPNAGFVTGGGWITSPAGAYVADPDLSGRANFGFVSKYKKGATTPDGQTQFQFNAAGFNFHSTSYEWLVVAGAHAKFKGEGTVNGGGRYGFMLTATDGNLNGGSADGFRIKVWDIDNGDAVVYDNQIAENDDSNVTTDLGGGSIVIHSGGKGNGKESLDSEPAVADMQHNVSIFLPAVMR